MTKQEAIEYCYLHEKEFITDTEEDGQAQFDCLIALLRDEVIKPEKLADYGMNY